MTKGTETEKQETRPVKPWRELEKIVAEIEREIVPHGADVKSPDFVKDINTGAEREVDVSIRFKVGSISVLIVIECRRRRAVADVTWIEQLVTKKASIGASMLCAVSATGFSNGAVECAKRNNIELRHLNELKLDKVMELIQPSNLLHIVHYAESITCELKLKNTETVAIEVIDPCLFHPLVNGPFFAAAFMNFQQISNPKVFWDVLTDGETKEYSFELKGDATDLIPIPQSEVKSGPGRLTYRRGATDHEVELLRLRAEIACKVNLIEPAKGRHHSYGRPGDADVLHSKYSTEVFGKNLDFYTQSKIGQNSPTKVGSDFGFNVPGQLIELKITDFADFDVKSITMKPVRLKTKNQNIESGRIIGFGAFPFAIREVSGKDYDLIFFMPARHEERIRTMKAMAGHLDIMDFVVSCGLIAQIPRSDIEYIQL